MTQTIDETKLEQLMGQMVGHMTGGALCFGIWLGDELGLVPRAGRHRAARPPTRSPPRPGATPGWCASGSTARRPAGWSPTTPTDRHLRAQPRGGAGARRRRLAGVRGPGDERLRLDVHRHAEGRRRRSAATGRWPGATTTRACSAGPSGSSAPATGPTCHARGSPRSTGSTTKLAAGGTRRRRRLRSRGVGRGDGRSAYPNSTFTRVRLPRPVGRDGPRAGATRRAWASGPRSRWRRDGLHRAVRPDLLLRLPARHGRPGRHRPATRASTWHRAARCCWSSRSPSTAARDNIAENPMAALLYTASSSICTPNSLSQEVGLGLGAQAGEARLRKVFEDAGFTHFRRAAETPMNLILEAKV